jgi:hypothetical protein
VFSQAMNRHEFWAHDCGIKVLRPALDACFDSVLVEKTNTDLVNMCIFYICRSGEFCYVPSA